MTRRAQRHRTRNNAGFSLMELVVSLAIVSVIFLAVTSLMLLARQQLAVAAAQGDSVSRSGSLTRQICAELALATSITEQTTTSIAFTVPDRSGDDVAETIFEGDVTAFAAQLLQQRDVGVEQLTKIRELIDAREKEMKRAAKER